MLSESEAIQRIRVLDKELENISLRNLTKGELVGYLGAVFEIIGQVPETDERKVK